MGRPRICGIASVNDGTSRKRRADFPVAGRDRGGVHEAAAGADHPHAECRKPGVGLVPGEIGEDRLRALPHAREIERGLGDACADAFGTAHGGDARRGGRQRMNRKPWSLRRAIAVSVADKDDLKPERCRSHGDPGRGMASAEHT